MPDLNGETSAVSPPQNARAMPAATAISSGDAIVARDLNGIVTAWNEGAERLFGFTAAEMIGRSITRIIPLARSGEDASILQRVRRGEGLAHFETERLTRDNRTLPVALTISPILDNSGTVIGISKIARDLSEVPRIDQESERREALLQSLVDTVPDGLILIDELGLVQSFNHAAERMFGFAAEEIVGRNVSLLMPGPQAGAHDAYIGRYLATGERRIIGIGRIVIGRRKNGATFPMELQIGEVRLPGSHLFTGYVRDLTERHARERRLAELQSELIHVSRLSELGQMVSALAHEVNQPLTAIANYLSGIRRLLKANPQPALGEAIEKVAEQAERACNIVQSLRGLVRKDARPSQVENLETLIQETSALAMIGGAPTVNLTLRIAPDARQVVVDKVQIQQVLLNLMRNAMEAMGRMPERTLSIEAAREGSRVAIRVCDSGPGLPVEVRSRLFQPFVTTKSDGLGVGLSICRTIVEAHGGELVLEDEPGHGAVFCFTVPGAAGLS